MFTSVCVCVCVCPCDSYIFVTKNLILLGKWCNLGWSPLLQSLFGALRLGFKVAVAILFRLGLGLGLGLGSWLGCLGLG